MESGAKCPVTDKRKYETEGEALATAAHQIETNDAPRGLQAYRCPYCESWHLTKNEGKDRDRGTRLKPRSRRSTDRY